jgi:glutamate---cysteine ligase / carboxylate-amine ligase
MALNDPPFTIGIEEEYLFVDRETRNLAVDPPPSMIADCEALLTGQVSPEFLRAQIEVETRVCTSVAEARADLSHLRETVASVANNHGMGLIAAATHPFAKWNDQQHTDKQRYNELAQDMQALARRLLICGLHVHVGIEDDDLRIDLMNQVRYFLPHLLALSTSSPFWGGEDSGLLSYRLSVFDSMPRSGLPDVFESASEYDRLVAQMVQANVIEDATKFWWDVRPSARYPTLEMRITDVCTRLDDSIAIAALYVCILSMLYRLRQSNQRWRVYPRTMINENRWLAQRYGVEGDMVDFGIGRPVPYADLLEEVIELVREDAERMDCVAEIEHAREIVRRGTSAQHQQKVYQAAIEAGAAPDEALKAVVDMLIEETVVGL